MSTPSPTYLQDSSGQVWLLGATNSALIQTTPVTGFASVPFVLLKDSVTTQIWKLTVLTSGLLRIDISTAPVATQTQIPIFAPNGTVYAIQVASGAVQTILGQVCALSMGDADSALASRLYDPTGQFWTQAERLLYIQEAFRTWNALTGYWRGDFLFNAAQGKTWYDITDTTVAPNTLRPLTLTSDDLYTMMEYHLLEPPVGAGTWTGSAQFALSDLQVAVQRRGNEVLGTTGCRIVQRTVPATPGRTSLPGTVIDVRRIAFIPAPGFGSLVVLWEDDSWAWQQFERGYTTKPPGTPSTYALSTQPLLTFDTDVQPNVAGVYELLTVDSGAPNSLLTFSLSIPDDWTWVVKWGALADLLSRESNAKDPLRAKYAETRYNQGRELLSAAPALLGIRLNNVPLQIDAVKSADLYQTGWEGEAQGPPSLTLVAGLNMIALSPQPDSGAYSMTATVVQNTPVPTQQSDCLLLTQDVFEAILDYAQHLAMFKCGGEEFAATLPLYQRFMEQAAQYASKLMEMGEFSKILYQQSQLEEMMNPRYTPDHGEEDSGG